MPIPSHVKHLKRGSTYRVIGEARLQSDLPLSDMADLILYQSESDGSIWARPPAEFLDGRFASIEGPEFAAPLDYTQLIARLLDEGENDRQHLREAKITLQLQRSEAAEAISLLLSRIRELEWAKSELALDVIAVSGQAQEAYESQLAAEAKLAEVEKERDALRFRVEAVESDRAYIIGANAGWDATIEQGETSEAVKAAMVRFWKKLAEVQQSRAITAEATVATLTAQVEAMRGALDDEAAREVDRLRLKAFATNSEADRMAYFQACSRWFQNRHSAALTAENQTNG